MSEEARVDAVVNSARGCGIIHFSGHADYDLQNPLKSALQCWDGPLNLAAIRERMDVGSAELVVLSACESALVDVRSSEEFVGLPSGLLEAGAGTVIACLWPVQDLSSAFLFNRFYELWPEQADAGTALRTATEWLRSATKEQLLPRIAQCELSNEDKILAYDLLREDYPFENAFHWAAFAVYGGPIPGKQHPTPSDLNALNASRLC
jgi:CHAT domain-containing protein